MCACMRTGGDGVMRMEAIGVRGSLLGGQLALQGLQLALEGAEGLDGRPRVQLQHEARVLLRQRLGPPLRLRHSPRRNTARQQSGSDLAARVVLGARTHVTGCDGDGMHPQDLTHCSLISCASLTCHRLTCRMLQPEPDPMPPQQRAFAREDVASWCIERILHSHVAQTPAPCSFGSRCALLLEGRLRLGGGLAHRRDAPRRVVRDATGPPRRLTASEQAISAQLLPGKKLHCTFCPARSSMSAEAGAAFRVSTGDFE